jgi:TolB-like protein/TolA-binding protein
MDLSLFLAELRRRRVFRVMVGYGVATFAVLQVVEPIMHALHLEDWVLTVVVVALALGFPVAVALAWAFDLEPGGLTRTAPLAGAKGGGGAILPVLALGLVGAAPVLWLLQTPGALAALPRWVGPAAGMALFGLLLAALRSARGRSTLAVAAQVAAPAEPTPDLPAVAVLPFADLSPHGDQAFFCDGIAEELLDALCCVSGLRVVSRSSSFQFKGRDVDSREVGRALGASTLLEGSVRKDGDRVRVAARLVDARDGIDLWAERFDRQLVDTFAVQEEIAQAVVRALRVDLSSREAARLKKVGASRATRSPQAYEHYLRGRHHLMRHGERRMRAARDAFRQAVALDPRFAQAHAGLADAAFFTLNWNLEPENVAALRAEALAASEEALRLEPELAEARLARANVLTMLGRQEEAERDFRHAIELNPGWGDACYFYARALVEARRYDDAAAIFEEAARRNPDDYAALTLLEGVHERRGDPAAARQAAARALEAVERRLRIDPDDDRALYLGAGMDLAYGDRTRGFERIERSIQLMGDDYATLYNAACFYARAGEPDRALGLLEQTVAGGRGSRRWIEQDPDLDSLREDPRFAGILARIKG